jgi:hypothetical protein
MKSHFNAFRSDFDSAVKLSPLLVCVLLIAASGPLLQAQSNGSSSNGGALFAGTWKGVCQDGKASILLELRSTANKNRGVYESGKREPGGFGSKQRWKLYRDRSSETRSFRVD